MEVVLRKFSSADLDQLAKALGAPDRCTMDVIQRPEGSVATFFLPVMTAIAWAHNTVVSMIDCWQRSTELRLGVAGERVAIVSPNARVAYHTPTSSIFTAGRGTGERGRGNWHESPSGYGAVLMRCDGGTLPG